MRADVLEHPSTEVLAAFLAGRVSEDQQDSIAEHLDSCETCCQALAEAETISVDELVVFLKRADLDSDFEVTTTVELPQFSSGSDRYEIGSEIARGGMGIVYRAMDRQLRRQVAVKVARDGGHRPSLRFQRLVNEAQITGQIQHPGVPPVYELGHLPDQRPFMAMKLIEGTPLSEALAVRSNPQSSIAALLPVFERLCETVAFAHSKGVVHRDLKPSNVLVGEFGATQVVDWGLARPYRGEPEEAADVDGTDQPSRQFDTTLDGSMLGTPAYMSPEQAIGRLSDIGPHSDVFALGSILTEILTGQPAFSGLSVEAVIEQARNAEVGPALARLENCDADTALVQIAKDCLQTEINKRPTTAAPIAERLRTYQQSIQEQIREAELERAKLEAEALEQRKRNRLKLIFASVITLGLISAAAAWSYSITQRSRRSQEFSRQAGEAIGRSRELQTQALDLAPHGLTRWQQSIDALNGAAVLAKQSQQGQLVELVGSLLESATNQQSLASKDLKLLTELDRILVSPPAKKMGPPEDGEKRRPEGIRGVSPDASRWQLPRFANEFRGYGLHPDIVEPSEASQLIRTRPARTQQKLIDALDIWLGMCARRSDPAIDWLVDTLQRTDESETRTAIRKAIAERDADKLTQYASLIEPANESPAFLVMMSRQLQSAPEPRLDLLIRSQSAFPGDRMINTAIAEVYEIAGNVDDAIAHYLAALATNNDPDYGFHLARRLAICYQQRGDLDRAIVYWKRAASADHPKQPDMVGSYGKMLVAVGRLEEGLVQLEKAIDAGAEPPRSYWFSIASAKEQLGDRDGAAEAAQTAWSLGAPRARAILMRLGKWETRNTASMPKAIAEGIRLFEARQYLLAAREFQKHEPESDDFARHRVVAAKASIAAALEDPETSDAEGSELILFAHKCLSAEMKFGTRRPRELRSDPILRMTVHPMCEVFLKREEADLFRQIWVPRNRQ